MTRTEATIRRIAELKIAAHGLTDTVDEYIERSILSNKMCSGCLEKIGTVGKVVTDSGGWLYHAECFDNLIPGN